MLTLGDKQEFEARIWSSACTRGKVSNFPKEPSVTCHKTSGRERRKGICCFKQRCSATTPMLLSWQQPWILPGAISESDACFSHNALMPVFLLYYYTGMAFPCRRKQQS
ncbi:unnamed protein product [Sphagnum jensenii]|uniref:Uncharacterized protein n=1 Tax=Sphagnum jensenii TaxID=128206 RepID=A0ABP1B2J1_9BRYO